MRTNPRFQTDRTVGNWSPRYRTAIRGGGTTPTARTFASASSQYLSQAAAIVPAMPFTVSAWFRDTNGTGAQGIFSSAGAVSDSEFFYLGTTAGEVVRLQSQSTAAGTVTADTTATYTVGAWAHACAVFASGDQRVFLNGANKITNNGVITPTTTRAAVGAFYGLSIGDYWEGDIAEVAIWNVILSDAEVLALATSIEIDGVRGYPPASFIRPDALQTYWPLFGNGSPELDQSGNGKSLTLVNTPTKAANSPPVVYPIGMQWASGS